MEILNLLSIITAVGAAFLLSFLLTPAVRVLAFGINAVDVPKDDRRIHKTPVPLIGGLAIYISFSVVSFIFLGFSPLAVTVILGGLMLVTLGMFDDVYELHPLFKLAVQTLVAVLAVSAGIVIQSVDFFGITFELGASAYPATVIWIVALTNAFNLIDGLDGLACGVCSISCFSLFVISAMMGNESIALLSAVLFGASCGFLPYNFNPAKIFMGDTGAYFIGFVLAVISVNGLCKTGAVVSFILPITVFAFPLFDTVFAFCRRIFGGKNPFLPDKRHLHHRLLDCGLTQRQTVFALYTVSAVFGVISIIGTDAITANDNHPKALLLAVAAITVTALDFSLLKHKKYRTKLGIIATSEPRDNKERLPLCSNSLKYGQKVRMKKVRDTEEISHAS